MKSSGRYNLKYCCWLKACLHMFSSIHKQEKDKVHEFQTAIYRHVRNLRNSLWLVWLARTERLHSVLMFLRTLWGWSWILLKTSMSQVHMETENNTSFPEVCMGGTKKCWRAKCIFKSTFLFTTTPESWGSKLCNFQSFFRVWY